MRIIAVAAVTAGGKTTVVKELLKILPNAAALYFDDYDFAGAVDDFYKWTIAGADYNVWNLEPLKNDICKIMARNEYEYLLLDYPFAYCHDDIKQYINTAIFIDTPLDIALARGILRDMKNSSTEDITNWLEYYLNRVRVAFVQMQKDILPVSDYVIDGNKSIEEIVKDIVVKLHT